MSYRLTQVGGSKIRSYQNEVILAAAVIAELRGKEQRHRLFIAFGPDTLEVKGCRTDGVLILKVHRQSHGQEPPWIATVTRLLTNAWRRQHDLDHPPLQ